MDLLKVYRTAARGYRLVGELDLSCLDRLDGIEDRHPSGADLRLDASGLTFIDGAGLERIHQLAEHLHAAGARLVILRPHRTIERALKRLAAARGLENLVLLRLNVPLDGRFDRPEHCSGEQEYPVPDLDQILASDYPPEGVCHLVADLAESRIEGAGSAAVALWKDGELLCAASSRLLAGEAHRLQAGIGEGPAIDAARQGRRVLSNSLVSEERWPEFTGSALYSATASVLAEPLQMRGSVLGVLSLFSPRENAFDDDDVTGAEQLAARGAVVVANSLLYWHKADLCEQLSEALTSRAVIDQAKGILMSREGLTADEAFGVLLRDSQRRNEKVHAIAQDLVNECGNRSATRSERTSG